MPVITVSRQTGSGGATIGQRLAERVGASYLNTQIIREVAQRLGISEATAASHDERGAGFSERLARALWLSDPSLGAVSGQPGALPFEATTEAFVAMTRQVVQEAARLGNVVIFGHGAQFILAKQPDVLHIRFIAPLPTRVERVMRRAAISQAEAKQRVRAEDQRRAAYISQYYHADWHASEAFHMIVNTALWDEEACIRLVLAAVEERKRHQLA
ncbi:MAG: cytidylate kinase-like family protein [Herpetosiphonaceae bacterium]|nr:cytidylate kinase-like family protein [Herpetosiphonaceae bacterium]